MSKREKVMFFTADTFAGKSKEWVSNTLLQCRRLALKCGLECEADIKDGITILRLWGSKWSFIKYYLATMICVNTENGKTRIDRFLDVLTW